MNYSKIYIRSCIKSYNNNKNNLRRRYDSDFIIRGRNSNRKKNNKNKTAQMSLYELALMHQKFAKCNSFANNGRTHKDDKNINNNNLDSFHSEINSSLTTAL